MLAATTLGMALASTVAASPVAASTLVAGPAQPAPASSPSGVTWCHDRVAIESCRDKPHPPGGPVTPETAIDRGADWIHAPNPPTYDQGGSFPDRYGKSYRTDCSGFVSMTWHLETSLTTESIESVAHRVSWDQVQPGDGLLLHRGGGRDGHVQLVQKVTGRGPSAVIQVMEFGSGTPAVNVYSEAQSSASGYYPIRYDKMQVVTDSMVREALADRVPKPKPTIEPPDGRTIVNFPTIFYTSGAPYHETVPMAGGSVRVELYAERTAFRWHFGDGATRETTDPGAPYPHETVTHPYRFAGHFSPSVDITWSHFRYRIVGQGGWHSVDGSFTPDGPQAELRSVEALDLLGSG